MAQHNEKILYTEITVDAGVEKVWQTWTTEAGVKSFFAPDCNIDLKVHGEYEMYFNPKGAAGDRGAEGTKILALQPNKMLSFTWNNPPVLPAIRWHYTTVVVRFYVLGENVTKVSLSQMGWGEGEDWDKAYEYFVKAWGGQVLPFLKHSLETGPVDWDDPPQIAAR